MLIFFDLTKVQISRTFFLEINNEMKIRQFLTLIKGNPLSATDESDGDDDLPLVLPGGDDGKVQKKFSKKKKFGPRNPVGVPVGTNSPKPYLSPIPMNNKPRKGLSMVTETSPPKKKTPKKSGKVVHQKKEYEANTATRRGRPPIYNTPYIPNGQDASPTRNDDNEDVVEVRSFKFSPRLH